MSPLFSVPTIVVIALLYAEQRVFNIFTIQTYKYRHNKANTSNQHKQHNYNTYTNCNTNVAGNDSYTTPTLKTLCTLDTHPIKKLVANDMLINIMIWNQPIVQYRMSNQLTNHTRSQQDPSIAVHLLCFD